MSILDGNFGERGGRTLGILNGLVARAQPVWELALGPGFSESVIRDKIHEIPRDKARRGAQAIAESRNSRKEDTRLRHIGEAMILTAVLDAAAQTRHNPAAAAVAEKVMEIAVAIPIIEPDTNPLVSDSQVAEVSDIMANSVILPSFP